MLHEGEKILIDFHKASLFEIELSVWSLLQYHFKIRSSLFRLVNHITLNKIINTALLFLPPFFMS